MGDLVDRLGCFLQVGVAAALFVAIDRWTGLPGWAAAVAAILASYPATFGLVALTSTLRGR